MNLIHKRAWVVHTVGTPAQKMAGTARQVHSAVAYCNASNYEGPQPTTTIKNEKVNCPRCKDIAAGRG